MKKITSLVMVAMTALSATTAFAGGVEAVSVEPTIVAAPTPTSKGGLLVLLLLGVTLAAVAGGTAADTTE